FVFLSTPIPRKLLERTRSLIDRMLSESARTKQKSHEPLEVVISRHPDWDPIVLERLVKEIEGNT
ncbi:MAG: hypothetical protein ACMUHB_03510, partial [Thermoplasmatota archaeon]